mgnify:CR=1 FL=1
MKALLYGGDVALAWVSGIIVELLNGEVLQLAADVVVCRLRCTHVVQYAA